LTARQSDGNWHRSDHVRLEAAYGYGTLDRFRLAGATHFFQRRLQLQFLSVGGPFPARTLVTTTARPDIGARVHRTLLPRQEV
jgi:hypothetical protein